MNERLASVAKTVGTPTYVYDVQTIRDRFARLRQVFGNRFGVSYAVKANPNIELLRRIEPQVATFDVSSFKEMERALAAGCAPARVTFSGPAKRRPEIERAIALGLGELVLESMAEAECASRFAAASGRTQPVLIRINPTAVPRHFGVNMAGKASQFGIDEEEIDDAIDRIASLPGLSLIGFHIYSGTNCLKANAIADNFEIFIRLFRKAAARAGIHPAKLVFGSGFGVPYYNEDSPLDVEAAAARIVPMIDALKAEAAFAQTECILEMGRWLVGPAGWLLTGVVTEKLSRGTHFLICDAGFNNHLAACGMMGTVIRRNWRYANVNAGKVNVGDAQSRTYTLVGPLCTTIDVLASDIALPETAPGDVLAIANSGAYGLTASPTRFISHPEPAEVLLDGEDMVAVSESALNHWQTMP